MSADSVENVADALVAYLKDASNWSPAPSMEFEVIKDATPEAYMEKLKVATYFVVPFGQTSQKVGRNGASLETFQVYGVLIRPLTTDFTRTKLAKLDAEIERAVRRGPRMAGCPCSGVDTAVKANPTLLKDNWFTSGRQFNFTGIR